MAHLLVPAAEAGYLVVVLAFLAFCSTMLAWMLYAWWTPDAVDTTGFPARPQAPRHSFSLIVPARHEEAVLPATLEGLAHLDHPAYEVLVVVGHDDPGTAAVARRWAARYPHLGRVVVDTSWPKNKPKALNSALPLCRGDVVAVFDAEDGVDPRLLRYVDTCLTVSGADIVQAGVQPMNLRSSWWALHSALEYFVYYRSLFHHRARTGFVPLGGNTVFLSTELVRANGGWDPECLTEDCELGVRLSARGAVTVAAYDAELVTREEAPVSPVALFHQRVRWEQGFVQVLRKGEWRQLRTRRQRFRARCTLLMPMVQACSWLVVPLMIAAALLVRLPIQLVLTTFLLFIPFAARLAVDFVAHRELCSRYGIAVRRRDYIAILLGTPLYQFLLAGAGAWALVREFRGDRSWYKTEHSGAHRAAADEAADDEPELAVGT